MSRRNDPNNPYGRRVRLGRRTLLGLLGGAGAYAAARHTPLLSRLAPIARAQTTSGEDRYLIFVIAQGGVRGLDAFDATLSTDGTSSEVAYADSDCTQMGSYDWYLPPAAMASTTAAYRLDNFASCAGLIRHVYMETAAHDVGLRYAISGLNRTTAAAGSIVLANGTTFSSSPALGTTSLSYAYALPSGGLNGAIVAEPSTLADWLSHPDYDYGNGSEDYDTELLSRVFENNQAAADASREDSMLRTWQSVEGNAWDAINSGVASSIYDSSLESAYTALTYSNSDGDTTTVDATYAKRMFGASHAITHGASRIVAVSLGGFDTHDESQTNQCSELCTLLGKLCHDLASTEDALGATYLSKTTIVVGSDFSRTYALNNAGGTDHYPWGSMLLLGGNYTPGIHGVSTARGAYPGEALDSSVAYTRRDVWATLYSIFGVDPSAYFTSYQTISSLL